MIIKVDGKKIGEAGHRSQYLPHAKRALYHLSYIPFPEVIMQNKQICIGKKMFPHQFDFQTKQSSQKFFCSKTFACANFLAQMKNVIHICTRISTHTKVKKERPFYIRRPREALVYKLEFEQSHRIITFSMLLFVQRNFASR